MFAWNKNGGKPTVFHMDIMEIQIVHDPWVGGFLPESKCVHKGDDQRKTNGIVKMTAIREGDTSMDLMNCCIP